MVTTVADDNDGDRSSLGTSWFRRRTPVDAHIKDCRIFDQNIGQPGTGGDISRQCGARQPALFGPIDDPIHYYIAHCWWQRKRN